APTPGRGGGAPPAAPPAAGGRSGAGSPPAPSKATGAPAPAAEAAADPKPVTVAPPGTKAGPTFGQQIKFGLTHFGAAALLQFISAYVMARIEASLFKKDFKRLQPEVETMLNQREGEIAGLLKMRKRIYANVHMDILSNYVPSGDPYNPGGDYRYFKTVLINVAVSTDDIKEPAPSYLKTVVTTLWWHRPFTYSFPIGDPIMAADMPTGTQYVLDSIASVLLGVSRQTSIGGARFDDLNKNLDTALRMLGKTWEDDWTKTAAMTDAERFVALKAAVDRAVASMNSIFGAKPADDERQMLAMLWVAKNQLAALHDVWPMRFEEGTWHGSAP
ncbi:MAG TPA: hypothetical protein VFG47_21920, partial [Geminicoccaceae bacterium]|nr:hypothetical protein [Geminicoccaceae bacterium]